MIVEAKDVVAFVDFVHPTKRGSSHKIRLPLHSSVVNQHRQQYSHSMNNLQKTRSIFKLQLVEKNNVWVEVLAVALTSKHKFADPEECEGEDQHSDITLWVGGQIMSNVVSNSTRKKYSTRCCCTTNANFLRNAFFFEKMKCIAIRRLVHSQHLSETEGEFFDTPQKVRSPSVAA